MARILGLGYLGPALALLWLVLAAPAWAAGLSAVPSAADTVAAYQRVSEWVRVWRMPPSPVDDDFRVECAGAAVTLRLGGRVLGRGTSVVGDGTDVHRAAAEAWREAAERLLVERDELALERTEVLAQRVTIEVELAGAMSPIDGTTYDAAVASTSPGLTGFAMRAGGRIEAVFPGVQMGTGLSPARALRAAAGALELPPVELADLRSSHQAVPLRFSTSHIAQVEPGSGPTFLERGGRYVPMADVTGARLREAAAAMANHLQVNTWTEGVGAWGLRGDYRAISGKYEPPIATARTQALAALALAHFARCPGIDVEPASAALAHAARLIVELASVTPGETDPLDDPVGAALIAVAAAFVVEADPAIESAMEIGALGARARAATRAVAARASEPEPTVTDEELAVVTWSVAVASRRFDGGAAEDRVLAEALVSQIVRRVGPAGLITVAPWVPWAMLELHPVGEVPGAVALIDFRGMVWARQIGDSVVGTVDQDFEGGVVLSPVAGPPNAAHTLRAIGAMPAMLGDPRVTPSDQLLTELAAMRRSLRFVIQLMFRTEETYLAREPNRALGGVRPALWEAIASDDATSMALITVCDALRAVRARSGG